MENVTGWLTTVVARVSLDMPRWRRTRREEPLEPAAVEGATPAEIASKAEAVLADSVGQALLIVLETLALHERLAFVLHDMFDVPFDDIAAIVDRSSAGWPAALAGASGGAATTSSGAGR